MANKDLTTVLLRNFSDRLDRISVDSLNEEGQTLLSEIEKKVENLKLLIVADKMLENMGI
jgi:hypothetical protein